MVSFIRHKFWAFRERGGVKMDILVGYTGFVGQNLNFQHEFTRVFNSKNTKDAYGMTPDLCVYSGVRAEKFRADNFPIEDLAHIMDTIENIRQIAPKKLVLISTVDVIPSVQRADIYEDTHYNSDALTPYGKNRLVLENEVLCLVPAALIIRLPALFGQGLKKNFIYDIINYVPTMLKKPKFNELLAKEPSIANFYKMDESSFYRLKPDIKNDDRNCLKKIFVKLGFSALNFTDSRSAFSFYNLKYLWHHIDIMLENNIQLAHMATEAISVSEIYKAIHGTDFKNEIQDTPFAYHFFKTRHGRLLGGSDDYIFGKDAVRAEIVDFVKSQI